jgi:hypothetical protein
MMPARPYGPAGMHRAPFRPEPIVLATAGDPADTQRMAMAMLTAGSIDQAHAILTSGADAGFPACRLAAGMLERNPPATGEARRILMAAVEGEA